MKRNLFRLSFAEQNVKANRKHKQGAALKSRCEKANQNQSQTSANCLGRLLDASNSKDATSNIIIDWENKTIRVYHDDEVLHDLQYWS